MIELVSWSLWSKMCGERGDCFCALLPDKLRPGHHYLQFCCIHLLLKQALSLQRRPTINDQNHSIGWSSYSVAWWSTPQGTHVGSMKSGKQNQQTRKQTKGYAWALAQKPAAACAWATVWQQRTQLALQWHKLTQTFISLYVYMCCSRAQDAVLCASPLHCFV